jgi:hypothetical protein
MQTSSKNRELVEVCKKLRYNQSIVFSCEGNLKVPSDITEPDQDKFAGDKPFGLWYSEGPAWVEFLTDFYEKPDGDEDWEQGRMARITHVYSLSINRSRVIGIFNDKQFDRFTKSLAIARNKSIGTR